MSQEKFSSLCLWQKLTQVFLVDDYQAFVAYLFVCSQNKGEAL